MPRGPSTQAKDGRDPRKEVFPKIRKQLAEMVESFENAGVIDGRSVEHDTEKEEGKSGNPKGAVN